MFLKFSYNLSPKAIMNEVCVFLIILALTMVFQVIIKHLQTTEIQKNIIPN